MSGLASRNRYFFWEPRPQPGELEYLSGAELRHSVRMGYDRVVRMPPALQLDMRNCELRHSRNRQTRR